MKSRPFHFSLTLITALLVLAIAVLAGGSLWALRRIHGQIAHTTAARSVLDRGQQIMAQLANQPIVTGEMKEGYDWNQFSKQVHTLHSVEKGLQYVSVIKDGVTVFHEQMNALDGSQTLSSPASTGAVTVNRRLLSVGGESLPVVVLSRRIAGDGGKDHVVEVALKREAVGREEQAAANAIASMFRVSLLTIVISFGVCIVLVVWMMRREAARERARREEEHLAFAGMLANGIVHDFRNPMSSLRLDAQMLGKEIEKGQACRPGRLSELAERMRNTTDRMDKVFQEFLYMSKPPSDAQERIELGACVRSCLAMLEPRWEQARVKVALEIPEKGVVVQGYESAVRRALMNVITNAEQFSPEGGTVTVRIADLGAQARIEVLDEGLGVPESQQKRIFDMFVTTRPGGTGLGLFLAKTAVERCGGSISVHNRSEGGACFRIDLPLATDEGKAKS
jgi:signal transduction histidine kinase